MRRRIRGAVLVVLGLVLTLSGALAYAYQEYRANLAGQIAQQLLQDLTWDLRQLQISGVTVEAPEEQMPQVTVDGDAMIGILQIEEVGIALPVLSDWDYEKLDRSPCRYSGTLEGNNLILLGHNYDQHLGRLKQLEPGDGVEFVDVAGRPHRFTVAETTVLRPTDVDALTEQPYPLAIFTCTLGGRSRLVVFCNRADSGIS